MAASVVRRVCASMVATPAARVVAVAAQVPGAGGPLAGWRAASTAAPASRAAEAAAGAPVMSPDDVAQFHRDGFFVVEDFWTSEDIETLRAQALKLVDGFDGKTVRTFSTTGEANTSRDDYFLNSGGNISFFFEEGAFDADGNQTKPKSQSINKIGHAMHDLDPVFQQYTYEPRIASVFKSLGFARPLLVQSMYIFKQAGIGGAVLPHQDGTFLYTEPQSVLGLWWPLEDCTTTNGCLWAVPGSHKRGVDRRFKRTADNKSTEFEPPEEKPWDLEGAVPLEMRAGGMVLIHHSLVHFSEENNSDKSRHAYTIHVVDSGPDIHYPRDNWLQRDGGMSAFNTFPEFA